MNRAARMLAALEDGQERSREEIFALAECFFLTNNAAAELRAAGHVVEQRCESRDGRNVYLYRLVVEPVQLAFEVAA